MPGTVRGSGETRKYAAECLPLCAKVIAREKDTPANKVQYNIENATVQTLDTEVALQVRERLALWRERQGNSACTGKLGVEKKITLSIIPQFCPAE